MEDHFAREPAASARARTVSLRPLPILLRRAPSLSSLCCLLVLAGCEPRLADPGGDAPASGPGEVSFDAFPDDDGEVALEEALLPDLGGDGAEAAETEPMGQAPESGTPSQFPLRRSIVSADGRSLSGEILAKEGDDIVFRRDGDGQVFVVSLLRLSADDQLDLAGLPDESVEMVVGLRGPKAEASTARTAERRRRASWHHDPDKAFAEAAATGLPVYVLFTGSDWCPPCKALERNVFKKREFQEFADGNLVLLMLDFPRRKAQGRSVKERNRALASQWGVTGFPSVFLATGPDGSRERFRGSRSSAQQHVQDLAAMLGGTGSGN